MADPESMPEDTDRPRGILSPSNREYLLGNKEYKNEATENQIRQDIRDRIYHSILDLELIDLYLGERDKELAIGQRIFDPYPISSEDWEINDIGLYSGIYHGFSLLLDELLWAGRSPNFIVEEAMEDLYTYHTLERYSQLRHIPVEVSIDFDHHSGSPLEKIQEKQQSREEPTEEERAALESLGLDDFEELLELAEAEEWI